MRFPQSAAVAGLLICGALRSPPTLAAQSPATHVIRATRVAESDRAPVVDGKLDDPIWLKAQVAADFRQFEPSPGAAGTERTEARVVIDGQAVYVAMRLHDAHADSIRSQLLRRDDGGASADWAAVILDSYHDRRTAYRFATTPRGNRTDVLHLNDTGADSTWDAVWDVAATVDGEGWSAEFRIPLSQLRFSTKGDMVWGINFARTIGRRSEVTYWAQVLPTDGRFVSLMGELRGLEGTQAGRPLELLPYALGRVTSDPTASNNPLKGRNVGWSSAGVDLKYGLTSNITMTATVNPDFGQVDADPSVVNLTAFENFYPERRPFFTEGTQIFNFPLVPEGFAFYSRRIGRAPQLAAKVPAGGHVDVPGTATILGALKLSGKTGNGTSLGLIAAVTDGVEARAVDAAGVRSTQPVEPASRYFVGRLSRDFRRGRSGFGALVTATNRDVADPAFNTLRSSAYGGGFDTFHRFGRDRYEITSWAFATSVGGSRAALTATQRSSVHYFQRPDADGFDVDSTRTALAGSAGEFFLSRIAGRRLTWRVGGGFRSSGFEVNDVGFVSYTDVWYLSPQARYRVTQPRQFVRDWWIDGSAVAAHTFAGQLARPSMNLQTNTLFRNFWTFNTNSDRWNSHLWPWELRGGPALRRSGYTNVNATLSSDSRRSWRVRAHARLQLADELSGSIAVVDPSFSFRPTSRTSVTLTPSWTSNHAPAQYVTSVTSATGSREYLVGLLDQTTVALTGRVSYTLNPRLTLDVYAQPFLSGGAFTKFRRVVAPHAATVEQRFPLLATSGLTYNQATARYSADVNGDGRSDFSFANPDFSVRALRTNTVVRWEFRPGSTIYFVWAQARDDSAVSAFSLTDDASELFRAPAKNVVMLKVAYWIDR
jgi:hypothetical protein